MPKLLITGTAGFCMNNLVRRAINDKQPYSFVSIDRINSDSNVIYSNKNHIFHIADITDAHIMDKIFQFEAPDVVIHGADESNMSNTSSAISSNVLGTQIIIDNCLKYKVKKLIFISTDKVYGQLLTETAAPWKETDPTNPRNLYGASKTAGELLVKTAYQEHGLIYNIVRLSNMYGPRQSPHRLVAKAIKNILENQKLPLYGSGLNMREWTHLFDACTAILTVLNKGLPNETYNISSNQEYTNIEVVQEICNVLESGHGLAEETEIRINPDFRRSMDSSKIKELGWKPSYKFKESIADVCNWYKMNQWFLK